jgi:hypothetical protein
VCWDVSIIRFTIDQLILATETVSIELSRLRISKRVCHITQPVGALFRHCRVERCSLIRHMVPSINCRAAS